MEPTDKIKELLDELGLAGHDLEPMRRFYYLLDEFNRHTNLTRITDLDDYWVRHIYDCMLVAKALPELVDTSLRLRVADVGCGGGLPLVVLAWMNPSLRVTGIESRGRKTKFIQSAIEELNLTNAAVLTAQAREAARLDGHAGSYDIVTMRAVAATGKMLREVKGLLAKGGRVVNFKTPQAAHEESPLAQREAAKFNMTLYLSDTYELPDAAGKRQFVIVS